MPPAPAFEQDVAQPPIIESPPSTAATTPAPASPAATAPRQIDWQAHAAFSARATVNEAVTERYRNLGKRKPTPGPEPEAPSIFEEERDVFGEEAEDVHGDPVVRLNKYCYLTLEKRVPTARDYRSAGSPPRMTMCMFDIGKPEARGDLFEHLAKDQPLPDLKEGTVPELPERIEPSPSP